MRFIAQVLWIDPVGQLGHPGHQLGGDLHVVAADAVQGADPEPGAQLDEGKLPLGQRPDRAGDEGAPGRAAVELGQELCLQVALPSRHAVLLPPRRDGTVAAVALLQLVQVRVGLAIPVDLNTLDIMSSSRNM